MDVIKNAISELERQVGDELDLKNTKYILKTKTAHLTIYVDDEDTLKCEVSNENIEFVTTDFDVFDGLYKKQEEE